MQRRQFIRISGGGAVCAALSPIAGCTSTLPATALEAWQTPPETADIRHWLLANAILAPHSHNLQSWIVNLDTPDTIVLSLDTARLLPETDPYSRQMMMSQGTFLGLLEMAARQRGLQADINLFPAGEFDPFTVDSRPTASITLRPSANVQPDPLFQYVFTRHTNRQPYAPLYPAADAISAITQSQLGYPVRCGFTGEADASLASHRAIARTAWQVELETPRAMLETFQVLRIGPREINEYRDGLSINSPMIRMLTALGMFDRSKPLKPGDKGMTDQLREFNQSIDATPAFFWMITPNNERRTQIEAGMAFVRAQLAATAHGLSMHPIQQALQEYPEQAESYAAIRQATDTSTFETLQMWARLGYGPAVGPSPRRGVASHIR